VGSGAVFRPDRLLLVGPLCPALLGAWYIFHPGRPGTWRFEGLALLAFGVVAATLMMGRHVQVYTDSVEIVPAVGLRHRLSAPGFIEVAPSWSPDRGRQFLIVHGANSMEAKVPMRFYPAAQRSMMFDAMTRALTAHETTPK
jgi:hypothetical protein